MNGPSIASWSLARLADAPVGLVLVGRWTFLLALSWAAHALLARRDPRWRVALWRATAVGLAAVAALTAMPPLVAWRVPRREAPARAVAAVRPPDPAPSAPTGPARPIRSTDEPPDARRTAWVAPRAEAGAMRGVSDLPQGAAERHHAVGAPTTAGATRTSVPPVEPWAWLVAAWLAGAAAMTTRLALGVRRLAGIVRRSREAPGWVVEESRALEATLGIVRGVRVVRTSEVPAPCLAGAWRPTLLLPDRNCRDSGRADLRAILAHELAHARGRDVAWNDALHVASIVLWFHPLAWRARAAHASACDGVCDAVAAALVGDVASYGRSLARLALQVAGPSPAHAHGLAMARTSDVRRRIEALQRRLFAAPLSRRLVLPALFAVGLLTALIGGLGITYAEPPRTAAPRAPRPEPLGGGRPAGAVAAPSAQPGRLPLRVSSARTGAPLEGVAIDYRGRFDGTDRKGTVTTGKHGTAVIEWPAGATVNSLHLDVRKPKYVGQSIDWNDRKHPVSLPSTKELRLDEGMTMTGLVRDEDGVPIAGATVTALAPVTESEESNSVYRVGSTKTDDRGRWRIDEAPEDLAAVIVSVDHPGYRYGPGSASSGRERLTILRKGTTVKGRVVDGSGNPVNGAEVRIGHDVWGDGRNPVKTDGRGEYALPHCEEGPTIVTAQAEGFAPEFREVVVDERGETAAPEIRLGPASVLRVKVVDRAGKPVAGAHYAADTWRGHRSIMHRGRTGADGRFTWTSAPKDAVRFDIHGDGYMRRRLIPLTASDAEQVVTLDPELVVTGRVTDASTGKPIPRFRVIRGREQWEGTRGLIWARNEAAEATGGRYESRFDFPMKAWYVRVEAPGYAFAESRAFRSDEGRQAQDFALQPAAGPSGVVLLPDGKPAAGVKVALATRENPVSLKGGILDRDANAATATTDPDGRFAFARQEDRFLLIAASDAGFADASPEELAKERPLVLQPWGRLEGEVRIGRKPGARQSVSFQPRRPPRGGGLFVFDYGYRTETDGEGRFSFDRVIPGPGSIARDVVTDFGGGGRQARPCWEKEVTIVPRTTFRVVIGGEGRPVVGRVVLDGTPDEPVNWRRNEPALLQPERDPRAEAASHGQQFAANLDAGGRFRIEDVPPGRYELTIPVNSRPDPSRCGSGTEIGRASRTLTVGQGSPDEPLDLGDVPARLLETLEAGDFAPDFTARRLDGGRFELGDAQGKLVLLDFWATWCAPCLAEMDELKELQRAFGGNPRFALVGLSCEEAPEAPARYAREHELGWTHVLAGTLGGGIAKSYLVRSIPATFLVGPDGRVLAKNLRGNALREAVRAALGNDRLFAAAKSTTRPARFPVTRFEPRPGPAPGGPSGEPSVVVLDDRDEDFREGRPHHDGLRILDASGATLHLREEFNNCQTVGGNHGVVVDPARGRIYIRELVAHRVTALDLRGNRIWQVDKLAADALAIDPRTGNLWCACGRDLANGETVVLDPTGAEVDRFPFRGIDLAYDPHTDGFWLVGYAITKLSREGKVLFQRPAEGWARVSAAVDPSDGSVWIVEREHPDVARSADRIWHLDARGGVLLSIPLAGKNPFAVACDPKTGTAWVVALGFEILRFARDGRPLPPLPIAAGSVAIGPNGGRVWVATSNAVLRLDEAGAIQARIPFESVSRQSWLAAF